MADINDRFINLPDLVAHHILSFLPITDLTRFGCASKRCRQLYLSTPCLNFHKISNKIQPSEVMRSLERFLGLRGFNRIQCLRIDYLTMFWRNASFRGEDEKYRVITWINNAVKFNLEVLELRNFSDKLHFPFSFFLCGSLRSLFLGKGVSVPRAPSLASFSNLEYLKFEFVDISDEGIFEWISCCCKCIKELHLHWLSGSKNVTIDSSSLKSFTFVQRYSCDDICHLKISGEKLEDIHIDRTFGPGANISLNVVAPNLKNLKWIGDLSIHQHLGEFMCLEDAELLLRPGADAFDTVSEILDSVRWVEDLTLNKETTMALFKGSSMPAPLENVYFLCIDIESWLDILVPKMVSFFGGMPTLSYLVIHSGPLCLYPEINCSGFNMEYWKLQNLAFIDKLVEVCILLCNGSNGIEFVRYILEHAHNLEGMRTFGSPKESNAITKLNESKSKMTSNATVVFL